MKPLEHYRSAKLVKYLNKNKYFKHAVNDTGLVFFNRPHGLDEFLLNKEFISVSDLPIVRISKVGGVVEPHGKLGDFWKSCIGNNTKCDCIRIPTHQFKIDMKPFVTSADSYLSITEPTPKPLRFGQLNLSIPQLTEHNLAEQYSCSIVDLDWFLSDHKILIDPAKLFKENNKYNATIQKNETWCYAILASGVLVNGPANVQFYDKNHQLTRENSNEYTNRFMGANQAWIGGQIIEIKLDN